MKYKLLLLSSCFLLSCGGGGPASKNIGISSVSKSYIQQDVVCCNEYDSNTGVCRDYGIPEPESITVTLTNEKLTEQSEPVQVRGCTVRFYPKDGAPEIPESYQYVSCTPTTIKPGESKEVTVTLQSPLIEIMHDYYQSMGKTLSYRMEIKFDITGYYTGENYDVTEYTDVDFSDFIKSPNDVCQGG